MKKMVVMLSLMIIGLMAGNHLYGESFIRVKGSNWNSKLGGEIKTDTPLLPGTQLNLPGDLDLDKTTYVSEVELKLKFGMNKLIGSYWKATYVGKKTLTSNINYGGETYNVNELVKSKLNLEFGSLLYERVFVPEFITRAFPSIAEAEAGLLLGVKYLSAEASLRSYFTPHKKEGGAVLLPVLGLFFQFGFFDKVKLEVGAVGLKASISDIDVEYLDFYSEVNINLIKYFPFGIGYKTNRFNLTDTSGDTFDVNLDLTGFYFSTSWEF